MKPSKVYPLSINSSFKRPIKNRWFGIAALAISVFVIARWFYYIDKYSVNLLFSDQWGFHKVFIYDLSLFKQFIYQHGPQRQGLGLVITGILNNMSDWNTRWISFCIGIFIFISSLVYLLIKKKLFGKINPFDSIIILITLSLSQFGIFAINPFMSHSAIPALFTALFCLTLLVRNLMIRNILLLIINLNLVFSSFGFFMGIITPLILIIESFFFFRSKDWKRFIINNITILGAILTIFAFFIDYKSGYISEHTTLLFNKFWEYFYFIGLSYSGFFDFKYAPNFQFIFGMVVLMPVSAGTLHIIFGLGVFALVCFVFIISFIKMIKSDNLSKNNTINKIIFVLTTYSLLYVVNLSIGRIEFGLYISQSSRYMTYLVPSLIGVYYYLNTLDIRKRTILISLFMLLMLVSLYSSKYNVMLMKHWHDNKTQWKEAYLKYEDVNIADSISNFTVYPNSEKIIKTLNYLKKNNLNLYLDSEENIKKIKE